MPVYLIFACEVIVFSFLIGAFMNSSILGLTICGLSSLVMYAFSQRLYSALPLVWGISILGGVAMLLWASLIDAWLGTTFVAILLGLLSGLLCYVVNDQFFKKYQP